MVVVPLKVVLPEKVWVPVPVLMRFIRRVPAAVIVPENVPDPFSTPRVKSLVPKESLVLVEEIVPEPVKAAAMMAVSSQKSWVPSKFNVALLLAQLIP